MDIDRKQKVARVFGQPSRGGVFFPLSAQESGKDALLSGLFKARVRLQASLDRRFLRFGTTLQEATILIRCVESNGTSAGRLALALGIDKGAITRYIHRLEQKHLVERETDQADRRSSVIRPTAQGKRLSRDLAAAFNSVGDELFAGLLESDLGQMTRLLARLYKNAGRMESQEKA